MVARQDRQKPSALHVALVLISAAAGGVAQRATVDPGLIDSGGGKKLGEKCQLRVGRGAGFAVLANVKPVSRRLDRKRLQLRSDDGNLRPRHVTHLVKPP